MSRNTPTRHPDFLSTTDAAAQALTESLEIGLGRRGKKLDRFATLRDLNDAGLLQIDGRTGSITGLGRNVGGNGGSFGGPGGGDLDFGENDLTKPARPTNVRARGLSIDTIGVSWDPPDYNNHAYAEVFAVSAPSDSEPSWAVIRDSGFNAELPIGPGNDTPYFMGFSSSTLFLHENLSATVPTPDFSNPIVAIQQLENEIRVTVQDSSAFSTRHLAYLSARNWSANGTTGIVLRVIGNDVYISGEYSGGQVPQDARLVLVPDEDDLDSALNPETIYYWVRFVSTARVVGDVQSDTGVPGRVQVNPTEILNILTGRIRLSHIANDLLAPINFVSGPIGQYDTVTDFVRAEGGALVSTYDQTLHRVILGIINGGASGSELKSAQVGQIVNNQISGRITFITATSEPQVGQIGDLLYYREDPFNGEYGVINNVAFEINNINNNGGSRRYTCLIPPGQDIPGNQGESLFGQGTIDNGAGDGYVGIASAAAYLVQLKGRVDGNEAYLELLQTLEAAFEGGVQTGLIQILSTIQNRQLVRASDAGALAYIVNTAQAQYGDDLLTLNQISQRAFVSQDRIENSISLRVQANQGGVLTTAGFGIGLEGDADDPDSLVSTFAVSADQFAVMSGGNQGRRIFAASRNGGEYRLTMDPGTGLTDALIPGSEVVVAFPQDAPADVRAAFRGRTFTLLTKTSNTITIEPADDGEVVNLNRNFRVRLPNGKTTSGYALFPSQNVPFIIDTNRGVVAIRGRLIVDGMVTATDAEITNLLTANEIWAKSITSFGLINTHSLIGETIATPRFGGWAMKIRSPDASAPRVMEFSRWSTNNESPPIDAADITNQENRYPQLRGDIPAETAFYLDSKQGSAYIRGNLTVGGNARFWTGSVAGASDHFVQMDHEFPLFVFPRNRIAAAGIPTVDGQNIVYNSTRRNQVRANSLFWANRDGTAGFNTSNGGVYINGHPLDVPNGTGYLSVIRGINPSTGELTGMGRVLVTAQLSLADNSNGANNNDPGPENVVAFSIGLFVVDASTNYTVSGNSWDAIYPSSRSGTAGTNLSSSERAMLDTHVVIIRAKAGASGPSYTYRAYQDWMTHFGLINNRVSEYFNDSSNRQVIGGSLDLPSGRNYRVLVVINERFQATSGRKLSGNQNPVCMPYNLSMVVQQVARTEYNAQSQFESVPVSQGRSPEPFTEDDTQASATLTSSGVITSAEREKLAGIDDNATANSEDAFLLNRANHTGVQLANTISDFSISAIAAYENSVSVMSQAEAEAGTSTTVRRITSQRIAQAIAAQVTPSEVANRRDIWAPGTWRWVFYATPGTTDPGAYRVRFNTNHVGTISMITFDDTGVDTHDGFGFMGTTGHPFRLQCEYGANKAFIQWRDVDNPDNHGVGRITSYTALSGYWQIGMQTIQSNGSIPSSEARIDFVVIPDYEELGKGSGIVGDYRTASYTSIGTTPVTIFTVTLEPQTRYALELLIVTASQPSVNMRFTSSLSPSGNVRFYSNGVFQYSYENNRSMVVEEYGITGSSFSGFVDTTSSSSTVTLTIDLKTLSGSANIYAGSWIKLTPLA